MTLTRALSPANVVKGWQTFWFREIPPDVYALLRIGLGVVGLLGLVGLTPLTAFWPADGIVPESGGGFGLRQQLDAMGLGAIAGYVLFAALVLAFTGMIAGYRTTMAIGAAWVLSVIQARWNPLPLAGSHRVLICLLFPLLWADCGRVLSIDARRRVLGVGRSTAAIWPLRLIRFQVALIYLNSGLSKLLLDPWRDGSAVHYAVSSNLFHRFPAAIPATFEWVATTGTYVTLAWEIGFAVMLLQPWTRRLAIGFGIVLHLWMGVVMELGTFSVVMLTSYLAFLDPDLVPLRLKGLHRTAIPAAPESL